MSKTNPSDTVSLLTDLFIKLCAINSLKLHLAVIDEESAKIIKDSILSQWEQESQKLFDQKILTLQEYIKTLPASERLTANLQVEKLTDQFKVDIDYAKDIVKNII